MKKRIISIFVMLSLCAGSLLPALAGAGGAAQAAEPDIKYIFDLDAGEMANEDISKYPLKTWADFVAEYPAYTSWDPSRTTKMYVPIFILQDRNGRTVEEVAYLNPTGFGDYPERWDGKYHNITMLTQGAWEEFQTDTFYLLYQDVVYVGPAEGDRYFYRCDDATEEPAAASGETIFFGSYEQDNDPANGKEPIEWLVLDRQGDRTLVISKDCLDFRPYDEYQGTLWDKSTIRGWLNGDFIHSAFSQQETDRIVPVELSTPANSNYGTAQGNTTTDRVFLLSIDEVERYLPTNHLRKARSTEYVRAKRVENSLMADTNAWWWLLRADFVNYSYESIIAGVYSNGRIDTPANGGAYDPSNHSHEVRPAMWITDPPKENATNGIAYASTQNVSVGGQTVSFQMYALKDENGYPTNYIKVRDLAKVLDGTPAQFEVGWENGNVILTSGRSYTANGSEMSTPFSGDRSYTQLRGSTIVNGVAVSLHAVYLTDDNGGGYTYYKLRDLGQALGFAVDWSANTGISIKTKPESP